jgi:hypothetical protein
MITQEIENKIRGKLILIGISFINNEGALIEQYQTHGFIENLTNSGIIRINRSENNIFQIPYDPEILKEAEPGEYRERTTGIIIKDPDFIMSWEVTVKSIYDLDEIKRSGYIAS